MRQLLTRTLRGIYELAMHTGHLERFLIFGSYVTAKEAPGDVDVVLVMDAAFLLEAAPQESRTLILTRRRRCSFRRQRVLGAARHPA